MTFLSDSRLCSVDATVEKILDLRNLIYNGTVPCPIRFCRLLRSATLSFECAILAFDGIKWKVKWSTDGEEKHLKSMLAEQQAVQHGLNEAYSKQGRGEIKDIKMHTDEGIYNHAILFPVCLLNLPVTFGATDQRLLLVLLHPLLITHGFYRGSPESPNPDKSLIHWCADTAQRWVSWSSDHERAIGFVNTANQTIEEYKKTASDALRRAQEAEEIANASQRKFELSAEAKANAERFAFYMSIVAGSAVGIVAAGALVILIHMLPWVELASYKNSVLLHIWTFALLICVSIGCFVKIYRKWCWGAGALSFLIPLISRVTT